MKLQDPFRRKEKLPNHLAINAEAHPGPAAGTHLAVCRRAAGG